MNKKNRILARDINHGNVSIKFGTEDFVNFTLLVNEAYHRLKDLNEKDNREFEIEKSGI